jgi:hypothetical protein
MAYRLKPGVSLVLAKDREGGICYHYAGGPAGAGSFGPIIPWLSEAQAKHFLKVGLVEKIDEDVPEVCAYQAYSGRG